MRVSFDITLPSGVTKDETDYITQRKDRAYSTGSGRSQKGMSGHK